MKLRDLLSSNQASRKIGMKYSCIFLRNNSNVHIGLKSLIVRKSFFTSKLGVNEQGASTYRTHVNYSCQPFCNAVSNVTLVQRQDATQCDMVCLTGLHFTTILTTLVACNISTPNWDGDFNQHQNVCRHEVFP